MSSHFSRSLHTLESNRSKLSLIALAGVLVLLGLWSAWFFAGNVTVFASTTSARLEVDRENHPVDAEVGGRVTAVRMLVGQRVKAGDVLIEMDALAERLAQDEEQARLAPVASQVALLKEELAAQERALAGDQRAAQAALDQANAESRKTRAAADFAGDEYKKLSQLRDRSLVSELDAARARNLAAERDNEAQASEFAVKRLTRELESKEQDRLAQIARLKREITSLEGTRAEARAASDRLGHSIDLRTVRAPISGRIAEANPLTPGSVLALGSHICTIVPDGDLRVVAFFPTVDALGRIANGQAGRVRLDGFPWTQYGTPAAHVTSVAGEPRDGRIRVELSLDPDARSVIPLQHGLPAQVDIAVERTSPASLMLRSVGLYARLNAQER
jgi:membrane fusion protein (multidrug efflux system)